MAQSGKTEKRPSPCNCLNLRRASLTITKLYDDFLFPSGLTVGQYGLLRHLRVLGPLSVSALAEKVRLDRTTLVRNLAPLEKAGLIEDISAPGARERALKLTDQGIGKCEIAEPFWNEAQYHVEQVLGVENLDILMTLLQRVENLR